MEKGLKQLQSVIKVVASKIQNSIHQNLKIEDQIKINSLLGKNFEYQTPCAVQFFNQYKDKKTGQAFGVKNHKELAEKIKSFILENPENKQAFSDILISEQGFLQIVLSNQFIEDYINLQLEIGIEYKAPESKKVLIDFSSPNIAKQMHVGHLRSTIIGESMSRILESLGHEVQRINHVGDWGTQFGMLIEHMKQTYPDFTTNLPKLSDIEEIYRESKKKFDADEGFKKQSQLNVVALQSGDQDCIKAWQAICDLSRQFFNTIYKRLNIQLKEQGESFYNSRIPEAIKDCEQKGLVTLDQGAKCIFIKGKQIPLMIQKSDGGFNYDSTDLAAIRYRFEEIKQDWLIYITDSGQFNHFDLVFNAAQMAGYHQPPKTRVDHMGFGVVLDKAGKKFKTREGDAVKLMDLLDEAKQRALNDLKKRLEANSEGQITNLDESELEEAAERIGIAAVKYFDLRQNRISDYKFDYDAMLSNNGNTAVYLLYSYVRICSILRKAKYDQEKIQELLKNKKFKITHPAERALASLLLKLPETISYVEDKLLIHQLTDFIYEVATQLASSYKQYHIVGEADQDTRILLMEATRQVMQRVFYFIGIDPVERI